MKTPRPLFLIFALLFLATAGCAPKALAESPASAPSSTKSVEPGVSESLAAPGKKLNAIRVLHVNQYEDRLPTDRPGTPYITLVQFEVDACGSLYDGNVKLRVQPTAGGGSRIAVTIAQPTCSQPTRQTLNGSTAEVPRGSSVTIENPILIEELAPSE